MTDLAGLHDELRSVARDVLGRGAAPAAPWATLVGLGWPALEVPEPLGGSGATYAETAVVVEELGRAASPVAFHGTAVAGVGALLAAEPSERRDQLLAGVAAGTRLSVGMATGEATAATVPFTLAGRGGALVVEGAAGYVVDAAAADQLLLLAADPDTAEPVVAVVAGGAVHVDDQPLVDATRVTATVTAGAVPVEQASVLRFAGDPWEAARDLHDRAALAVAGDALGSAAAMLDATVAYAGQRRQFDRPIGSFQAVKHQCADMLVQVTVGRALVAEAVRATVERQADRAAAVARAKAFVGATAVDVVGTAMQLHGGLGYTWESGIHVHLKRALLDRALFGSPPAHRRRVAANLLRAAR